MIEYLTGGFVVALFMVMFFCLLVIEQVDKSYRSSIALIKDIAIVMLCEDK